MGRLILSLVMPMPKFTEEEIKAAEKDYADKEAKAPRNTAPSGQKYRSLHYIDDEEYEDVTDKKSESKPEPTKEIEAPATEEKAERSSLIEQAPLKEDSPREKDKKED